MTTHNIIIQGTLVNTNKQPLANLRLEAWDEDLLVDDFVGEAVSDTGGNFLISFSPERFKELFLDAKLDIYFKIYAGDELIHNTENMVLWNIDSDQKVLNIVIDRAVDDGKDDPNTFWLRVFGVVRNEFGEPLNDVTVQVFDRDLRSEEVLGRSAVQDGQYEVRYKKAQFRKAEKDSADIVIKILDAKGKELHKSVTYYNAPNELEVNINLKDADFKGLSEWDTLTATLNPLMEGMLPLELREDEQFQDVSFLAGESGRSQLIIGTWIICYHLADKTQREETSLAAAVFFAFIRQGQPALLYDTLLQDIQHPERVELLKDKILRGLSSISPELQKQLLEKALTDNLIPARIRADIDKILDTLRQIKLHYAADNSFGAGKGTIGQLLQLIPEVGKQQTKFIAAFTDHTGSMRDFWKKLETDKVFVPEIVRAVKLTFELGALTRNHIPLVAALNEQFKAKDITAKRDLAKLDRSAWVDIFKSKGPDGKVVGVPANIDGETEDKKFEQYGAILEKRFERSYATTSFMAKLDRNEQSPVTSKSDVVRFLDTNPTFHLDRYRIDHFIAENPDALKHVEDKEAAVEQLKSIQRVFKLNPTHQAIDALLSRKIESAQQIYFMGREQVVTLLKESGINKIEGKKLYQKAENAYALALTYFGNYNLSVNGLIPYAVPDVPNIIAQGTIGGNVVKVARRDVTSPKIVNLPNLQTLFGSLDYCECTHCRSVYSPAAHFVDVLRFLGERNTNGTGINLGKKVKQVLLDRRPDLGKMELSCENTNTPLPYIDLVNEILEDVVAAPVPNSPTKQTHLTAAELRANPEYTNPAAYNKLAQEVFPFNLPFNLWYLQSRAYLNHLGVGQPRLFELFQQQLADGTLVPGNLQMDCAWLGIHETERKIITRTLAGKDPWHFWGLERDNVLPHPETPTDLTTNVTGTWIDVLSHVSVMLHRTGLTYKELLQLLDMPYVNPAGIVYINDNPDRNAANCDTTRFRIVGLTPDVLDRMHRFIRLWRRLGCAMWELDMLLTHANPTATPDVVLQDISRMNRIREKYGWDWRVTLALFNKIDHGIYFDRSKSDAPAIQTLYQRLFRNKLVDATAVFPESPNQISGPIAGNASLTSDKVPGILAAFRISEEDLNLILTDLSLTAASALDWAVLSRIYRITLLAKAIGLNIDQFIRLKRLSATDPFANPDNTLKFIELAEKIAASGFSVPELDYVLAHKYKSNTGVALEDKSIIAIIKAIQEGLQKVVGDIALKTEETLEAYIKSKLGLLPALTKDSDQSKALAIINGTWTGTPSETHLLIDKYFVGVLEDLTIAKTNFAPIPPTGTGMIVEERFQYFQDALQNYLLQTQKETFIKQKIAEVFQLEVPSAGLLLSQLQIPPSPESLLQHLSGTNQLEINEANFPNSFKSLRLLHKNAMVIGKLKMKADELNWLLTGDHAVYFGWPHPNDFPIDTTTFVHIVRWVNISDFFAWKNKLPKSELTAFEFMDKVLDAHNGDSAIITALSELTAWEKMDITDLVAAFDWNVKQEFIKPASLLRLRDCILALRRLGVNAARAIVWAKAEPTFDDAESLKQTVKAKYDLAQWQQVIQPFQDVFREQKRDALVSWLVSQPNHNWMNTNALYSYFLIDVEMSACMLTSRLKQATASAQLFVQRCLMNLEADISVRSEKTDNFDTTADTKWKQWKWMKYYRVWEANRKVFLYPENWIEPELRDEKSPFFKELENELMQNDINRDTAEQAYLNYLEKLDKVANLEIRAMYNETISADESVLHVFGRTRSSLASEYFYRKRINKGRWTAWEKVELEIAGNHLMVGIHNRRLYLLWPQFLPKAVAPTETTMPSTTVGAKITLDQPNEYWEIRLFWSELKKGKWTPKVLSDSFSKVNQQQVTGGNRPQNISFRTRPPYVSLRLFTSTDPTQRNPIAMREFQKIGQQISAGSGIANTPEILFSSKSSYHHNNLLKTDNYDNNGWKEYWIFFGSIEAPIKIDNTPNPVFAQSLAKNTTTQGVKLFDNFSQPSFTVIDASATSIEGVGSFFVWNDSHTYLADLIGSNQYAFYIHYHPFIELFIKELNIWGIKGLLNRRIQVSPESVPGTTNFNFKAYYLPTFNVVPNIQFPEPTYSHPVEDVDFSYKGAYALYNWELFFHVPFHIANKLASNQRFEEALEWFHYIFNPTNTDNTVIDPNTPQQKYWVTKPFYETTKADYYKQKIENLLLLIAKGDLSLIAQVDEWRTNPFNPHLIARMRTVAYQKSVLIKYIQTIVAWGDQLFRRNTIETINEATQLYILADSVLGPRPKSIPKKVANPIKTFYQLEQESIDVFGNALKEVENLLPSGALSGGDGYGGYSPSVPSSGNVGEENPELPRLDVLYFCIPHNEKLLTMWDTVADRLFKIRHCMNIEGMVQKLPLFDPPIDPSALVRAAAGGLDLGAVLAEMNAPMPLYRFNFMIQKALELCNEVKSLGAAMLSALEKKDAEAFALLRSSHELVMMDAVRDVKNKQIEESLRNWESIMEGKKITQERKLYYEKLVNEGWNFGEILSFSLTTGALIAETAATVLDAISSGISIIPDLNGGVSGAGGSPVVSFKIGGKNFFLSLSGAANVAKGIASILQTGASMSSTVASYDRRATEWDFQKRLAEKELPQIDKQIVAASVRHQIAETELRNHDRQKENSKMELEYMHTKFTNQELYDWMINQISTVYFQSYQLAFDIAKRAERCFRYELGLSDSNYIQFGYWDSLKKGLLSGEKLYYDLKRMETAYYEQNRREYELTKHISLSQLEPIALLKLRKNGECIVDVPETLFDMDYPGHYFRRIKSVSLSIPCIVGPYSTVACTLTLMSNKLRKDPTLLGGNYERVNSDDLRFRDEIASIQSIATSSAQHDSGMFELNFRDERYLPFEGAGAIGTWHIKLNKDFPQFDLSTISDVILHLNYTSREGGGTLKNKAVENFNQKMNAIALAENKHGLSRVYDIKREFSTEWNKFLHPATAAGDQILVLDSLQDRLPYFTRQFKTKKVSNIEIVALAKATTPPNPPKTYKVMVSPLGIFEMDLLPIPVGTATAYQGLRNYSKSLPAGSEVVLNTWTIKIKEKDVTNFKSLPTDAIEELFLIIHYTIT